MVNAICAVILLLSYTFNTRPITIYQKFKFLSPLIKLLIPLNPSHLGYFFPKNIGSNIFISNEI